MATKRSDWEELKGSPVESGGPGGLKATMKFIGPWDERFEFVQSQFLARNPVYPHRIDDTFGTLTANVRPISYTMAGFKPESQKLQATALSSGRDQTKISKYDFALVSITYALPSATDPIEIRGDRGRGDFISERFLPTSEFVTLEHQDFEWESGDAITENEAPGKLINGMDYIFTRHRTLFVPQDLLILNDHVNTATLRPLTPVLARLSFPPETVLLRGSEISRAESQTGETTKATVSYRFSLRMHQNAGESTIHGWNSFFRARTQEWEKMKTKVQEDGSGGEIFNNFPLGDFLTL